MTTWISRLPRLRGLFAQYRSDPYVRGRASEVVAAALIADGLVGLDNPLRAGHGRRSGIVGALFVTTIGLLFAVVISGLMHQGDPYPHGTNADGVVSAVSPQTSSTGENLCTATITYQVKGRIYSTGTGSSSSQLCSEQGTHVVVSYSAGNPSAGRAQLAGTSTLQQLISGIGGGLLIVGIVMTLFKLAEIVGGIILLVRGRRLVRSSAKVPAGELLDDLKVAWNG